MNLYQQMRFSQTEKIHLLKAWFAISLAFAILISNIFSPQFIIFFMISLLTVGIGFLFHEMAHKFVAQKYGCWAEFRSDDRMLMFAVFSAFLGFIFAAPGAVYIHGRVTTERNGKISLAGPVTNIALALIFLALAIFLPGYGLLSLAFNYGFRINSFIGLFNMIPALNLDGQKILRWNKAVYFVTVALAGMLVFGPWLF
jgi:Zn-dependent protease